MPVSVPAILLHSNEAIYSFGLVDEWDHLWLHEIVDSAERTRLTIMNEDLGLAVYEGYQNISATYTVDCHTYAARGLANYHPGWQITPDVLGVLFNDLPFHVSKNAGVFVFNKPSRRRSAADFHHVPFTIDHLFPEGDILTSTKPGDPDHDGSPIVLNPDPSPGDQGDGTGDASTAGFQVLRLFYDFLPARGSGGSSRSGYVTRLVPSTQAQSLGSLYLYGNPPGASWNSPAGPDWSANDQTATPAAAVSGRYTLTKVYDLLNNSWLMGSSDANKYDSASHGTDVIVSQKTDGSVSLKIGDFPDLASVVAAHAGSSAADFNYIWNAITLEYYRLVIAAPSADPAAFWRITRPQAVASGIIQAYFAIGHRVSGTYKCILASRENLISPAGAAGGALDYLPAVPPKSILSSPDNASPMTDYTVLYNINEEEYDFGDSGDLLDRTVGGPHLWIWKWGPNVAGTTTGGVPVANSWWWKTGSSDLAAGFGTTALGNYAVVFCATVPGGRYYKGSPIDGDPLALTTGIVLY